MANIHVGPLSLGGLHALISTRLGRPSPRPKMARIAEISGGNPFYALANLTLVGRPFRAENGVVVALRRRGSMVLRDRALAGRWSRVVGPSLLPR